MTDAPRLLQALESKSSTDRYEACEELRIAPSLSPEEVRALRSATKDTSRIVADAATRALAAHPEATSVPTEDTASTSLELRGRQGKVLTVEGDTIRIVQHGIFGGVREKTILIRNITSVEVKKPGAFVGFIQFSIAGGKARDSSFTFSSGAADAVKDENSVVFEGQEPYDAALRIKRYVETWSPAGAASAQPSHSTPASAADEIRKLKALEAEGIITAEEFEAKKKALLGL